MSYITKGNYQIVNGLYSIQPNRTVAEKNDGTVEGSVVYKAHKNNRNYLPAIYSAHPDDDRLQCYQISITYEHLDYISMAASYFGLISPKTNKVFTYSGGQNNDPIETHPDFEDFAGTKADPLNGAKFDDSTGLFLGFVTGEFKGVEYYLTPSTLVSASYWTRTMPRLKQRMKIVSRIRGFRSPPGVGDYLLLDTPYRQVGSFYQVTEQYLGSGPDGWNSTIYNA